MSPLGSVLTQKRFGRLTLGLAYWLCRVRNDHVFNNKAADRYPILPTLPSHVIYLCLFFVSQVLPGCNHVCGTYQPSAQCEAIPMWSHTVDAFPSKRIRHSNNSCLWWYQLDNPTTLFFCVAIIRLYCGRKKYLFAQTSAVLPLIYLVAKLFVTIKWSVLCFRFFHNAEQYCIHF
jgi:hypothetical protein